MGRADKESHKGKEDITLFLMWCVCVILYKYIRHRSRRDSVGRKSNKSGKEGSTEDKC